MAILLNGYDGRLGTEIMNVAREREQAVEPLPREHSERSELLAAHLATPVVLCDVTLPAGTSSLCKALLALPESTLEPCRALVIGTTGHNPEELAAIEAVARKMAVVMVPNFSLGIFLFEQLLEAKTALGPTVAELARTLGFDLALWEAHHTRKLDAPSGTAKALAHRGGIPLERVASTRVGQVVGEHTLFIAGDSEELRITHTAHTRRLFAAGAVALCQRILGMNRLAKGLWRRDDLFKLG